MAATTHTRPIRSAEILFVGTELLLGDIVNTNAAYLSRALAALGIPVYHQTVVGDNPERLKRALADAFVHSDLVVTSGGLGPTYDDLTKETVAAFFGRKLVLHEESLARCRAYFERTHRVMPEHNVKQAMLPEGAIVIPNDYGTAPAVAIEDEDTGKTVIMLPGRRVSLSRSLRNASFRTSGNGRARSSCRRTFISSASGNRRRRSTSAI